MGVNFTILSIDDDKLLLQQMGVWDSTLTVPQIGQIMVDKKIRKLQNLVASESELLLYCSLGDQEKLLDTFAKLDEEVKIKQYKNIKLDVCFELGLDWALVGESLGKTKEKIIGELLSGSYPLINYGFQPGFMYLDGLADGLQVPRLEKPRLRVPQGSLAIGGKYLGVYGSASPGGWNLIGRTPHVYEAYQDKGALPKIGQSIKLNRLTERGYLAKYES